jgi:hypothetical protein
MSEILYESLHALLNIIRYATSNRREKCLCTNGREILINNQYTFPWVLRLSTQHILHNNNNYYYYLLLLFLLLL